MLGTSNDGFGVSGSSENGYGVVGSSEASLDGVLGNCAGTGNGVHGTSAGTGNGVVGNALSGIGVVASGGRAQFMITPASGSGAPTKGKHDIGELFLDKHGALFICVGTGKPGTWKTVVVS
jgi:hypothetical protein